MTDGVSLKLTPDSKTIIAMWTRDKKVALEGTIDRWLVSMLAWMERDTMKAFDDGKQPGGPAWSHKYSDLYAALKISLGKTNMGIFSGALRRAFAHGKIRKTEKESEIGSTLPYANMVFLMFPFFTTVKRGEDHAEDLFIQLAKQKGLVS